MSPRTLRLIINGKAVGNEELRQGVAALREAGHDVEVRVTWEDGDARRWAAEAGGAAGDGE